MSTARSRGGDERARASWRARVVPVVSGGALGRPSLPRRAGVGAGVRAPVGCGNTRRLLKRVQMRGGARRPHARRTPCTLSVRPRRQRSRWAFFSSLLVRRAGWRGWRRRGADEDGEGGLGGTSRWCPPTAQTRCAVDDGRHKAPLHRVGGETEAFEGVRAQHVEVPFLSEEADGVKRPVTQRHQDLRQVTLRGGAFDRDDPSPLRCGDAEPPEERGGNPCIGRARIDEKLDGLASLRSMRRRYQYFGKNTSAKKVPIDLFESYDSAATTSMPTFRYSSAVLHRFPEDPVDVPGAQLDPVPEHGLARAIIAPVLHSPA